MPPLRPRHIIPLALCGLFVASHLGGCAAGGKLDSPIDDSSSTVGGAGGTTAEGGAGPAAGMSNTTVSSSNGTALPCGIDCSTIETDPCHEAVCNEVTKQCAIENVPDGLNCDDGLFCTIDDQCQAGECNGGGSNDCDVEPPPCNEVLCVESTQSCSVQLAQDGAACTATDLCVVNTSCVSGLCVGTAKDCFFAPIPNECHVATCNPNTGVCEPAPGNPGVSCEDPNDLCVTGKTCDSGGNCLGGQAVDCSNLTVGCVDGVCDPQTGQCAAVPVAFGGHCAEGDSACTQGECDNMGQCISKPAFENQSCNDFDGCTEFEECTMGNCTGGQSVTACVDNDGCCPGGCTANNDQDCACGIDKLLLQELFIGVPDYVAIHNPTPCIIDLDPLVVFMDDPVLADVTVDLPQQNIGPNETVYIIESGAVGTDIDSGGNIGFSPTRSGFVIMCDGACNMQNGSNVLDAVVFETTTVAPALPPGLLFMPSGLTGIDSLNQNTMGWLRTATMGSHPNFFASDWTVGAKTK